MSILTFTACKKEPPANGGNTNVDEACDLKQVGTITIENKCGTALSLKINGADFQELAAYGRAQHSVSAGFINIVLETKDITPTLVVNNNTVTNPNYYIESKTIDVQQCTEKTMIIEGPCNSHYKNQTCVDKLKGDWLVSSSQSYKNGVKQPANNNNSGSSTSISTYTFNRYLTSDPYAVGVLSIYTEITNPNTTYTSNQQYQIRDNCSTFWINDNSTSNGIEYIITKLTASELVLEGGYDLNGERWINQTTLIRK